MVHDFYLPALRALRAHLQDLDGQRQQVIHAISAIENLPEPITSAPDEAASQPASINPPSYGEAVAAVLREAGESLHINHIASRFKQHGWFLDKDFIKKRSHRNSLVGGLDRKVREGDTLTKPAPATYGLLEWSGGGSP